MSDEPQPAPVQSELRTMLESVALQDVLKERIAQIDKRGHTSETDGDHPLHFLPGLAAEYAGIARDRARPGTHFSLPGARKKAVQAAALALAAVERLDAELARLEALDLVEDQDAPDPTKSPDLPGLFDQELPHEG